MRETREHMEKPFVTLCHHMRKQEQLAFQLHNSLVYLSPSLPSPKQKSGLALTFRSAQCVAPVLTLAQSHNRVHWCRQTWCNVLETMRRHCSQVHISRLSVGRLIQTSFFSSWNVLALTWPLNTDAWDEHIGMCRKSPPRNQTPASSHKHLPATSV